MWRGSGKGGEREREENGKIIEAKGKRKKKRQKR